MEPQRSRPRFEPGYGISQDEEGMLDWRWAEERLAASRNFWIVTSRPDGAASVAPVWGLWWENAVVFGTNPSSAKGRNLERDPRVVVHLESGDEVVILRGEIERGDVDESFADAYEAKYDFRPPNREGWFWVRPQQALAWLESDYPNTATLFRF